MTSTLARRAVLAASFALAAPFALARPVSLAGSGATETYDCDGDNATISGSANTVTLKNCDSIRVLGSGNRVRAERPSSIAVLGSNNKVTWTGSREPKISNLGVGNSVNEAARSAKESAPDAVGNDGSGNAAGVDEDGEVTLKPGGRDLVLKEDGETATHDCHGRDAVVKGDDNTYRFRGCRKVVINGDGNTVDAGAVEALDVRGDGNTVSWTAAGNGKPRIRDEGTGNTIRGK